MEDPILEKFLTNENETASNSNQEVIIDKLSLEDSFSYTATNDNEKKHQNYFSTESSSNMSQEIESTPMKVPNKRFSILKAQTFLVLHCLGGCNYGFNFVIMNTMGNAIIIGIFDIPKESYTQYLSMIVVIWNIAKVSGTLLASSIIKKYGLKNVLYIWEFINIQSIILVCQSAFQNNIWIFAAGRLFNGMHSGGVGAAASRLPIECFPKHRRGMAGCTYTQFSGIATFGANCVGSWFSYDVLLKYWLLIMLWGNVLAFLRILLIYIFFNFDTASYYAYKAVLHRNDLKKQQKYEKMIDDNLHFFYEDEKDIDLAKNNLDIFQQVSLKEIKNTEKNSGFVALLKVNTSKDTRWAFISIVQVCCITISASAFFDTFGVLILDEIGGSGFGYYCTSINGYITLFATCFMMTIVNRCRRKVLIYTYSFTTPIFMLIISYGFYVENKTIVLVGYLCHSSTYAFLFCPILLIWTNEQGSGFASGIGISISQFVRVIVTSIVPLMFELFDTYTICQIFSFCGQLHFQIIRPLLIETKNKQSMEIANEIANFKYKFF